LIAQKVHARSQLPSGIGTIIEPHHESSLDAVTARRYGHKSFNQPTKFPKTATHRHD